jgi:hypothetical protein
MQERAEKPPVAVCKVTLFVIAETPFRPSYLRFDNLPESWLSTGKSTTFQFGCVVLRLFRDAVQVRGDAR